MEMFQQEQGAPSAGKESLIQQKMKGVVFV